MNEQKIPINREDDGELLGFIMQDSVGWEAQTIFGYPIAHTDDKKSADQVVRSQGLLSLIGLWQYFDKDDKMWHPCIIKEAFENKVIIIRTNALGYQEPDDYKIVTINKPSETTLVKS
jgi:hypothetical protein